RANRTKIRDIARGKRVLNLFAYTCGFSVAAALGGAEEVVSVDASVAALERGRANMLLAGVDSGPHPFLAHDVFSFLDRARRKCENFDVIILDPPSYSTTKSHRFSASSDYGALAENVLSLLRPKGQLFAFTNHRGIGRQRFRRILHEAARAVHRE